MPSREGPKVCIGVTDECVQRILGMKEMGWTAVPVIVLRRGAQLALLNKSGHIRLHPWDEPVDLSTYILNYKGGNG